MIHARTRGVFLLLLAVVLAGGLCAGENPSEAVYRELDRIREEKKAQLTSFLKRLQAKAKAARNDEAMRKYFLFKKQYAALREKAPPPPEAVQAIEKLKQAIRQHYLRNYLMFYDILFVNEKGYVFSSIRHEKDYRKNLFKGRFGETALSKRLQNHPGESFVDYEFYIASDEPSAFFVEPVVADGTQQGWLVLQCAINKINNIFARADGLGRTGEVFLVNRQQQMLTQSRFRREDSILKQHLSRKNIESKFAEGLGHKFVVDYRGYRALTSFEVCPVMNSRWLLIAKIDEDEMLTRYYRKRRETLRPRLLEAAVRQKPVFGKARALPDDAKVVDIDEFQKAKADRPLMTFGVSTCTGMVVELPDGVSFLAHISTYDRIYGQGDMDLVGHLFKRIRQFEIYPYQLRSVRVVLVAPHRNSLGPAVDMLLQEGLFLSQIRFLHVEDAKSAMILHDRRAGGTAVEWKMDDNGETVRWQYAADAPSLGTVFASMIGYAP